MDTLVTDTPLPAPPAARLIVRLLIGQRTAVVRLLEPPQRGEIIKLLDGTRVEVRKVKQPRRGDPVDAYCYAKLVD